MFQMNSVLECTVKFCKCHFRTDVNDVVDTQARDCSPMHELVTSQLDCCYDDVLTVSTSNLNNATQSLY